MIIKPTAPINKKVYAETPVKVIVQVAKPKIEEQKVILVPEPAPVVVQPVGCEAYRNEVAKYGWNVEVALAVMKAESGCNPNSVGDNFVINGLYAPSCGLFQVRTLIGRPTCEELKNPEINVAYAHGLYLANGWSPWSVCNHGIVSCY